GRCGHVQGLAHLAHQLPRVEGVEQVDDRRRAVQERDWGRADGFETGEGLVRVTTVFELHDRSLIHALSRERNALAGNEEIPLPTPKAPATSGPLSNALSSRCGRLGVPDLVRVPHDR